MNEHFVTSLAWSERLKKAGVEQEAEYWWEFDGLDEYKLVSKKEKLLHQGNGSYSRQRFYAAYLTDELAGMLSWKIRMGKDVGRLEILKTSEDWIVEYHITFDPPVYSVRNKSLPNALAAMVEYCKQKGLI